MMEFLKKIPDWLKLSIKIVLTFAALLIVFYKIDFIQVSLLLADAKWWLLIPAFILFIVSKIIASFRLNIFFGDIEIYISEKKNLKLYWLGMFYNLFLPGGIGGDGYKIYLLNKKFKIKGKKIFQAVLIDRLSGLSALVILAILLSVFLPLKIWIIIALLCMIPTSLLLFYKIIKKLLGEFRKSFKKTTLLSFLVQVSQLISVFFIIKALNIEESTEIYLFIFLLSSVIATIPFTIGGIGARELTFLYAAAWLNLNSELSISISFIFFIITAIVSLFGIKYNLSKNFEHQFGINTN